VSEGDNAMAKKSANKPVTGRKKLAGKSMGKVKTLRSTGAAPKQYYTVKLDQAFISS
jgi:hypothetical protein